jgi:hypothetical protein
LCIGKENKKPREILVHLGIDVDSLACPLKAGTVETEETSRQSGPSPTSTNSKLSEDD